MPGRSRMFSWCSSMGHPQSPLHFFSNESAATEIYTLSLHDALPIYVSGTLGHAYGFAILDQVDHLTRSEEHTSELQSRPHLVCRHLLEKQKAYCTDAIPAMLVTRATTTLRVCCMYSFSSTANRVIER